jgi:class 3 adenylate cyclase
METETQYVRSGDTHIAYQVIGNGPIDIAYVPGWVSHVELCWEDPDYARFLNRLTSFARLIMFDKRGTGLSDRVPNDQLPPLEVRMDDLNVVMDAVGSKKAALLGFSEGGNLCALFAATYPERTLGLIMFGSFAKRIWSEDYPWAPTSEQRQHDYEVIEREWGNKMDLEHYIPSKVNDPAFTRRLATYFRRAASPGAAVALLKMNTQIDISNVLPSIHVPTLILHRTDDRDAKIEEGRWMAERISGAKFKELPGEDHLPWVGDQEAILDEVQEFITGSHPTTVRGRALATIMFTDIVGSTEILQKLGDDAWRVLLEKHDKICFDSIVNARGRLVNQTGDGVVAAFDGPSRGIACAREIIKRTGELGLEIRGGLHTGECEIRGKETVGLAVHLAARVVALAGAGEILVSRTVQDLVSDADFEFEDRGSQVLKGFPEKWQLFSVK